MTQLRNRPVNIASRNAAVRGCLLLGMLTLAPVCGAEMQSLEDQELSWISGQDGIELEWSGATIPVGDVTWDVDASIPAITAVGAVVISPEAYAVWRGVGFAPVNTAGVVTAGPSLASLKFDVGSATQLGDAQVGLNWTWSRIRTKVDSFSHESNLGNSTGAFAFDSSGSLQVTNLRGLFNTAGGANLSLAISDASMYFRQGAAGSAEVLFDNISFNPSFTGGTIGISPTNGLTMTAPLVNWDLTFDLRYEGAPAPAAAFTYNVANDRPILYYGWQGALTNFEIRIRGGGVWYGTTGAPAVYDVANRSEGLNFYAAWDYDPTFAWVVGESNPAGTGNPRMQLRFDQWQKIGTNAAFYTPNNTLDVINAGQGPSGLCWGTQVSIAGPAATCATSAVAASSTNGQGYYPQFLNVSPDAGGIALVARDVQQMAYNTRVTILDDFNGDGDYADVAPVNAGDNLEDGTLETQNVQWGLIYTLGNLDANIFVYPGGYDFTGNVATANGLRTDFTIMTQSHDGADANLKPDWNQGSHYMIADTTANFAIGLQNASILLMANDLYVSMLSSGLNFRTHPTTGFARVQLKANFGGGDLPNMNTPVLGFDINANFESNNFQFTLEPPTAGQAYLGYSGLVDLVDLDSGITANLPANFAEDGTSSTPGTATTAAPGDDGTFISIAEPSQPGADVRLANITGRVQWTQGKIDLVSDSEIANDAQKLVLQNNLQVGTTGGGTALVVGRVEFSNLALGTIAAPSGTWFLNLALKRQN